MKTLLKNSLALSALTLTACGGEMDVPAYDKARAVETIKTLSADDMEGRWVGTDGNRRAADYIMRRMKEGDLMLGRQVQNFAFTPRDSETEINGSNLVGRIDGQTPGQGPIMVITAHYDHVGIRNEQIYNGADDNASGVAALFALAESFRASPPKHDIVFAFLDAEEAGLKGAEAFLKVQANTVSRIALNVNLDMVSRANGAVYASGTFHNPVLKSVISKAVKRADIEVKFGHDLPDTGQDDWTLQSDHARFHQAGIPFIYFGVEDHPDYHKPTDDFEKIDPAEFLSVVDAIVSSAHALDEKLAALPARHP